MHPQTTRLQSLKERGYQPQHVLDIGACFGKWTDAFQQVFPDTDVLLIEGNDERREVLEQYGQPFEMALLGAEEKDACIFYVGDRASTAGNSIYREQTNFYFREVEVPLQTLDGLLERTGRADEHFDFIKIDVQGAELDVLRGAPRTLERAEFVLMEVRLLDYNKGAPTFSETIAFMENVGFRPCDLFQVHHWLSTSLLCEMDILFARKNSWVFSPPLPTSSPSMSPADQAHIMSHLLPVLTQKSSKRLVVIHNKNDDLMGNYMAHKFTEVGIACTSVSSQGLARSIQPGSVVYVLPGALEDTSVDELSKLGCLSITGYPALVEKGMVSIGLLLDDEKRLQIIASNSALTREGVRLPEKLQGLISSMSF